MAEKREFTNYTKVKRLLRRYITRDLFPKGLKGDKLFKLWSKNPVHKLVYLDKKSNRYQFSNFSQGGATDSVIVKLLLRIRKENTMEELKKELQEGTVLPESDIQEIQLRAEAMAKQDVYKQELIKRAKKAGWLGVTLGEVDHELSDVFRRMSSQLDKKDEFDSDDLKIIAQMQAMKRDKTDVMKFHLNHDLKLQELEEKKKARQMGARTTPGLPPLAKEVLDLNSSLE